jgi:SPP1 family predicted phage head-tail adaptor
VIGKMKPIRLIQYTSTQNGSGRWTETAANSYNIFGELVKTGGGRQVKEGQTKLTDSIRFKIFFREDFDLTGDWRLVWSGKEYTIERIDRIDERRFNWLISGKG